MSNLTPKQLKVLRLIAETRQRKGYAPTMQELADRLNVSKVTIFEHVEALIRKKLLTREANKARSLKVAADYQFPADSSGLPLAGYIAAGRPIETVETEERIDIGGMFADNGRTFVLKVRGDSMIDKQICDGDFVVIRRQETADDGDIVVALVDDREVTLKTYFREKNRVRLQPANEAMEPIFSDNVRIQGVVSGVVRKYAGGRAR
jgi:repressor LexA